MILEKLSVPKVVKENITDIIKLYVRYGPDYGLISKEFQLIVEQRISTKIISQLCFQLNKQTYKIIVAYLKQHKEKKGQKQIPYDDLWPEVIEDSQLRIEIENLPTKIMKVLNKDLSEAYNLLMESMYDATLVKLIRYDRIRDLYQFVTEIILKENIKASSQPQNITLKKGKKQKEKVESTKLSTQKKTITRKKTLKPSQNSQNPSQHEVSSSNQWSVVQERYLCALYMSRPLSKCCQKFNEKYGESQKWNTTRKVFKKSEEIFEKSLKQAFRSNQLKQLLEQFKTTKDNLIGQIVKRKSNQIQKFVLKFYKSLDSKKKAKNLQQISKQISSLLQIQDRQSKVEDISEQKPQQVEAIKQEHKQAEDSKVLTQFTTEPTTEQKNQANIEIVSNFNLKPHPNVDIQATTKTICQSEQGDVKLETTELKRQEKNETQIIIEE